MYNGYEIVKEKKEQQSELPDDFLDAVRKEKENLKPGGPPVDYAALNLYIAKELDKDETRKIREHIVTWESWNAAWWEEMKLLAEAEDAIVTEEIRLFSKPEFVSDSAPREPDLDQVRAYHSGELDPTTNSEVRRNIIRYKDWNDVSQDVLKERADEYRQRAKETLDTQDEK